MAAVGLVAGLADAPPRAAPPGSGTRARSAGAPRPGGGRSPPAGRAAPAAPARPRSAAPGGSPPGCASSTKRPRRSSQSRSTSAGVAEGRPSACSESDHSVLTSVSQSTGPPRSRDPPRVEAEPAVAPHQQREAEPAVGAPAPDRFELGRGVEPGLVGLHDPEQAVALEVAVGGQPVHLGADPRLRRRVADRDPPGPGQQRRLDRLGLQRAVAGRRCRRRGAAARPARARRSCGRRSRRGAGPPAGSPARPARGRGRSGARRSPRSRSPSTTARGSGRGSARCRSSAIPSALALLPVLAQDPLGLRNHAADGPKRAICPRFRPVGGGS